MALKKVIFHIYAQNRYEAGLIEQVLRSEKYEAMFVSDIETLSGQDCDVAILQPSLSDWRWLEMLITLSKDRPRTPVVLYTQEISPGNDMHRLCDALPIFIVNDITTLKNSLDMVMDCRFQPTKTVLFVDDDQHMINAYRRMLRKSHWNILSSTNGEDALRLLQGTSVDCVVTDIKMPNLHGLELISRIRETDVGVPIVVCSGYPGMKEDHGLKFFGVAAFIEKPVDGSVLEDTLKNLLT